MRAAIDRVEWREGGQPTCSPARMGKGIAGTEKTLHCWPEAMRRKAPAAEEVEEEEEDPQMICLIWTPSKWTDRLGMVSSCIAIIIVKL